MWVPAGAYASLLFLASQVVAYENHTKYSTWMITSMISRNDGVLTGAGDASALLQAGFTQKAFRRWLQQNPHDVHSDLIASHIRKSVDSTIEVVSDALVSVTNSPLDRLSTGNNLIILYERTHDESYRVAFDALRHSIDLQPRNAEGGLWYFTYPNWSYLDGMASLAPFYTLFTELFEFANTTAVPDDMVFQIELLWEHCRNDATGLLVHGYDSSRMAVWANNRTGASPYVWGRSLGWFSMALVDTLELLPNTERYSDARGTLLRHFRDLSAALVRAVDPKSGAWWQILDQPERDGNYIESSGSAMFTYSLLRGARLGYIPSEPSTAVAIRAYEYIVHNFVVDQGNSTLGYTGTVSVCSLNSTASYEYYVERPMLYNSVLGTAAFAQASLEYEILER
ncbi:glycoside hydrolase family 105 protein [Lophiostoma macrostomum CBS 122681]|uniref:Glycoside hydrolase family 105 protein n=1 Tax=Lophiostoma macrostomum CBS 122681 TaxID=1314788 RepID=A0A6A6SVU4_9PLEO|nr:glycoside hydrolase family 105 protein [Lophiostoma macrostomum CBS 122681]